MTLRTALVASALVLFMGATGMAQQQTGEIFGRVVDKSGAVLPGATVTVAGPALLQPRTTVTSETGTYRVAELPVGTYSVTFELAGFRTVQRTDVRITIGFRAPINGELELSSIQETVTVTGESPLIDTKATGTKSSFDLESLQNLPTARDPWVMLEKTPGIAMDRANVGGSASGQQSGYISRGSSTGNNKWAVDGVDITDMSATGASPIYYDFDMLEEMQVTTGGADASQQTGGVGINLVTRSGTDRFKGSGRYYVTDDSFQADNITPELKKQGAGTGAPIQNIKDYGFEVGGPIAKGKAWYWGSYGIQDIKVGVVGFYKNTPTCRPTPPTDTQGLRDCLETDLTTLNNYNWKVSYTPFNGNKLGFQNTWAAKVRNARDASDLRPIETTYRQKAIDSKYGAYGWISGPSPFWKASDQHIFNDKLLVDVQWAHLGNNFVLDFHEDALADVQPRLETTTGAYSRSYQQSVFARPTNSLDVTTNYFLANKMGGDHAFKIGLRWRSANSISINHWGGNAIARYTNGVPNSADLYRDGNSVSHLNTWAGYAQDSYTVKRLTVNLGFRVDMQDDSARPGDVPANPIIPNILPALSFPGADANVTWTNFSPRLGMTYDISGKGRTVANASYAVYYGQMAPGQLSGELAATGAVFVRYGWADANADGFVQASELNTSTILSRSSAYDPNRPSNYLSPGTVDSNIKNDRTQEFIVGPRPRAAAGLGRGRQLHLAQVRPVQLARRAGPLERELRAGGLPGHHVPVDRALPGSDLLPAEHPAAVGVHHDEHPGPRARLQRLGTHVAQAHGEPLVHERQLRLQRRDRSLGLSPAAYEDPTNIDPQLNGAQYAPVSSGSGVDSVYTNAKWLMKVNGSYLLPKLDINIAGGYQGRQGFPHPQGILSPNRANSAGQVTVLLAPLGETRLPNYNQFDLRVDRAFTMSKVKLTPSMDIFNLTNGNTVFARRRNMAAANADLVTQILSPRVIRFGVRASW